MADPTILVVDDDHDACITIAHAVRVATGARVIQAGSVAAACVRMRAERPDLVISDVVMPWGGGRAVAAEAEHLGIPCRLMSSSPASSMEMAPRVTCKADVARFAPVWLLHPAPARPKPTGARWRQWWGLDAQVCAAAIAVLLLS